MVHPVIRTDQFHREGSRRGSEFLNFGVLLHKLGEGCFQEDRTLFFVERIKVFFLSYELVDLLENLAFSGHANLLGSSLLNHSALLSNSRSVKI